MYLCENITGDICSRGVFFHDYDAFDGVSPSYPVCGHRGGFCWFMHACLESCSSSSSIMEASVPQAQILAVPCFPDYGLVRVPGWFKVFFFFFFIIIFLSESPSNKVLKSSLLLLRLVPDVQWQSLCKHTETFSEILVSIDWITVTSGNLRERQISFQQALGSIN